MAARQELPYKSVYQSDFVVELEFEVPDDFWEEKEQVFHDPSQTYFWQESKPTFYGENWLEHFHAALQRRGWPTENIDAIYSYFNDPVEDPDLGEEPGYPKLMKWNLFLPGEWLVNRPHWFLEFDHLSREGLEVKTRGDIKWFKLVYWRISGNSGPLEGEAWEGTYFYVKQRKMPAFEGGPKEWFPKL
jgi:hypothetical protein